jgi:hypothetical protein
LIYRYNIVSLVLCVFASVRAILIVTFTLRQTGESRRGKSRSRTLKCETSPTTFLLFRTLKPGDATALKAERFAIAAGRYAEYAETCGDLESDGSFMTESRGIFPSNTRQNGWQYPLRRFLLRLYRLGVLWTGT